MGHAKHVLSFSYCYLYNGSKPVHPRLLKGEYKSLKSLFDYHAINPQGLKCLLTSWLKTIKIPIIIDDGLCFYVILDFISESDVLIIGDPHYNYGSPLQKIAGVSVKTTQYSIPYDSFMQKKWMMLFYMS